MGRLGLGALLVLSVACGGVAQRDRTTDGSAIGGAGSGSGGTPSSGGSAIASGGAASSAGAAAAGGASPVGGAGAGGELSMDCDNGAGTYYYASAPDEPVPGFVGTFDGTALTLSPATTDQYTEDPGTIRGEATSCLDTMSTFIQLRFEAPHAGDVLTIVVNRSDSCTITAYYGDVAAEIDLEFKTWLPDSLSGGADVFLYGDFSARVPTLSHLISGKFAMPALHTFCLI